MPIDFKEPKRGISKKDFDKRYPMINPDGTPSKWAVFLDEVNAQTTPEAKQRVITKHMADDEW